MKAQMFLVSFVFAVGLIFVIQQSLFQYTDIDISEPANINEFSLMQSALDAVNRTLVRTYQCESGKDSFRERMEELKNFFARESIRKLYSLSLEYDLDCSKWENVYPAENPVNLTIRLNGPQIKASGTYTMYHHSMPAWWNPLFEKCMTINVANAGSSTIRDFPLFIRIPYDSDMLNDYGDLRFVDSGCNNGGSLLNHEIESTDASGAGMIVRIPDIPASGKTISVYYGNPAETYDLTPEAAWNQNFKAVWHFDEDPSGTPPQMEDISINMNNGITNGGMTGSDSVPGRMDNALDFDGVDDYVNGSRGTSLRVTGNMTLSMWIYPHDLGDGGLAGKYDSWGWYSYAMWMQSGLLYFEVGNAMNDPDERWETKASSKEHMTKKT